MQLTDEQILDKIRNVCVESLKVAPEQVTVESRFKEDLGADSLDTIILLMALEQEFKKAITDDEARGLAKVKDVIALVRKNQAASL